MDKVGRDGVITVDEQGMETSLEVVEGMQFDRGYHLLTLTDSERMEVALENPYILLHRRNL